jgi:hypothetical protein
MGGKIMFSPKLRFMFVGVIALLGAVAGFAQTSTFSDSAVDYTFEIPDTRWKMTVKPTAKEDLEYVFVERNEGHLEIRKLNYPATKGMHEILRDEETKLRFNPGFVAGKDETFGGKLSGGILNFEFVRSGRPMAGRFYFLRSGDSVYALRFTGYRDKLRSIRNQSDIIARTFNIKS